MTQQTSEEMAYHESDGVSAVIQQQIRDLAHRIDTMRCKWWMIVGLLFIGFIIFGLLGDFFNPYLANSEEANSFTGLLAILGGVGLPFTYIIAINLIKRNLEKTKRAFSLQLTQANAASLQDHIEDDFFIKLVKINFKYLDQYYFQTQEQADKSFRLSMFCSVAGFIIIIVGVILMFAGISEPAYVTTGAGVISEAISALFFYLYNKTIVSMAKYHQKLVITQNVSVALKIAEGLPEAERIASQQNLITCLTTDVNKHLVTNAD